jgi:Ca2+-binding RTX toxin-like protein
LSVARAAFVLVAAALAAPSAAVSATARVVNFDFTVRYEASPSETNAVVASVGVVQGEDAVQYVITLEDAGASIQADAGCVALLANRVVCTVEEPFLNYEDLLRVGLGDGADTFAMAGSCDDCGSIIVVKGGAGDDTIGGSDGLDYLYGGSGEDQIDGLGGSFIGDYGEEVGDLLFGGSGSDRLDGGAGADLLQGGAGADILTGGRGLDTVVYWHARRSLSVDLDGTADDGIDGEGDLVGVDVEEIAGGRYDDRLTGNERGNSLWGDGGRDILSGGGGSDLLEGGSGRDVLRGGPGGDVLVGSGLSFRFGDVLTLPGSDRDLLLGGPGPDRLRANDHKRDVVRGGAGRDRATVDRGLDRVAGVERVRAF